MQNSPANRVPSHGTRLFGTAQAIDFVPVDATGRSARVTFATLVRSEPPESFAGFGRELLVPRDGVVVAVHDSEPDHGAYRGIPSIGYALTQRNRIIAGWVGLAGNHVLIEAAGAVVALCHLQQHSARVSTGQAVRVGDVVALCGNSGNSTEPHLHLQAISDRDPARATAVAVTFRGGLPRNGDVLEA